MLIVSLRRRYWAVPAALAAGAAVGGALAARHYHRLGLTLTHYDARGHLIVARRIIDSITPGWQQVGAVWLPLPHLLNMLPAQIDLFYRTGASAVAISVLAFALAAGAIAWTVRALTSSTAAAIAATLVFTLNPNVVYLQSTPMTEPLLLATTTAAVAMLLSDADATAVGVAFALACLTRYEAWPVTVSALAASFLLRWRATRDIRASARQVGAIAAYPAAAIVGFAIFSRVVIGQWFVAGDFFVPENKALGDWWLAAKEIAWGTRILSGDALVWIGGIGTGLALLRSPIPASLLTMAAVPWAAFYRGHPFRIRYMVPLIAIEAVGVGVVAGIVPSRRIRAALAAALVGVAVYELRPLDDRAPMVLEAQWDRPNEPERARVTACIGRLEPGAKIMASMGSLGHYMQEASRAGFAIRDFLHEGNGDIWLAALERPQPFAEWMLIEEKAEGGDMLARLAREKPSFLAGYERVCEGAGMALFRRADKKREDTESTER